MGKNTQNFNFSIIYLKKYQKTYYSTLITLGSINGPKILNI